MNNRILLQKITWTIIILFFTAFLVAPMLYLFWQSFGGVHKPFNTGAYKEIFQDKTIITAFFNSLKISLLASVITTIIAFICAYAVHMTRLNKFFKKYISTLILVPMFIPTITYGFVLIYIFGNQGIISRFIGHPLFTVYGTNGLLIGYVIYTLPAVFLILANAMQYTDRRLEAVSHLMRDNALRRFYHTIFYPMLGAICSGLLLSFVMSFTDYGIPASVGGTYEVISMTLYEKMLGTIPNISEGAVVSMLMLIPAVIGVMLLQYMNRFNAAQNPGKYFSTKRPLHDNIFGIIAGIIVTIIAALFAIMFYVPFTQGYPYKLNFTTEHLQALLADEELLNVFLNSFWVALLTAVLGLIISFFAAFINTQTDLKAKSWMSSISLITNAIPGMVLGLSYLLLFNFSSLKGTFLIIVISIVVHYFTTPYVMAKNALEKISRSLEVTSTLMGDSWWRTIFRVFIPNIKTTIVEILSYYFINAMVTISGVIFLVTTTTMLASTKINELQHFNKFNEIFILSIFIFLTNVIVRLIADAVRRYLTRKDYTL